MGVRDQARRLPIHLPAQRQARPAFSRGGHDWSEQLPAIVEAMRAFPVTSVTLDGEVVIGGADGAMQLFDIEPLRKRSRKRGVACHTFMPIGSW
jgi:ATP-dependent DNA ligase